MMLACHAGDPGSIPGSCKPFVFLPVTWAASEPMQPTPLLLSAEEGGRVSRTLVSSTAVRWKCPSDDRGRAEEVARHDDALNPPLTLPRLFRLFRS